ncbi:acyl-CoA-binding domain-containing protein 6-like [Haliotis rubra]|uniref:acyl-CoA-binding domain-containing protein 6-like n=1 Tax=Haliotis rubra TaxID=36100 RepID=UPI001EE5D7C0|nr:acyl-CoA-binding domain-containing protein 6-like [Haliotis rubra]
MAYRRTTSVSENDPVYRVVRPKPRTPRLLKTDPFNTKTTPNDLHWAAEKGNINLLAHLLMENQGTNITDPFGRTPLHEAAANDQLQAADWLMFHGADPHIKDFVSTRIPRKIM